MMDQLALWHDSIEDALEADVMAIGGPKTVAYALWPAKSMAEGARYLRRCLDSERAEKLALDEVAKLIEMAAENGSRCAISYLGRRAHAKIIPVAPDDERAELLERWESAQREVRALARAMGALD